MVEFSDGGAGVSAGQAGRGGREYSLVPLHHPAGLACHASHSAPPPRGGADEIVPLRQRVDGWTAEKQRAFLENLATCGSVAAAARSVGLSREGAYALRRRAEGRGFAQAWDAARLLANDNLVDAAWDRALHGVTRAIYYHGEQVGEVVHHDSRLLLGLIAQNRSLAERLLSAGGEAGAKVAGSGRAGSPYGSGAVVRAVLADWDAALDRVERGEALAEPEPLLPDAAVAGSGAAEALPPPLPVAYESDGSQLDEAQVLSVGCYAHWWDARLECWLTNWPAPEDWAGTRYCYAGLSWVAAEVDAGADDEDCEDGDQDAARTLTVAEEAGLAQLAGAAAAAHSARLALYRRAAFGLASAAELAALAAVNSGWHPRGAVADRAGEAVAPGAGAVPGSAADDDDYYGDDCDDDCDYGDD